MTPTPKQLDEWQAICDAATDDWSLCKKNPRDIRRSNGLLVAGFSNYINDGKADAVFAVAARTGFPAALAALREMQWRPIDDEARSGKAILCVYHDSLGREHNAHAKYIPRFTEQVPFSDDNAEYCEEKDEYFTSEGWYEICEAGLDYNSWKMDYEPTLYMNIPAPPAQNAAQPGGEG